MQGGLTAATAAFQFASDQSPYHFSEQSAQNRMGTRNVSERIPGRASFRNSLTDQARDFFEELPLWFIGARWELSLTSLLPYLLCCNCKHVRSLPAHSFVLYFEASR